MILPALRRTLIFLLLSRLAFAAQAADLRVDLPDHGALALVVPDAWTSQLLRPAAKLPPLISISPATGKQFKVLITPILPPDAATPKPTAQALHERMSRAAAKAAERSVQKDLPLIDFAGPAAFGTYFSATDRDPEPNGFKYLTQGAVLVGDVLLTFTVLSNSEPDAVQSAALQMFRGARWQP